MKIGVFTLILSIGLWPMYQTLDPTTAAFANTNSSTTTCTDNRGSYQGFNDGRCYNYSSTSTNNQQSSQDNTENLNDKGAQQSQMMGMMAIAAGMAMIAAGVALMANPPTAPAGAALVAAGVALLMAGMQALAAAGNMNNNANKAGFNSNRLGGISGLGPVDKTKLGQGGASGIKIDPSLTRTGKAAAIFDDFEQKTGLSREELFDGIGSGKSPASILAGSKKLGASEAQLQNLIDKNAANGPMSAEEAMAKMGITPEDLSAMSATGEENTYGSGGAGGGSRKPASESPNIDALFGGNKPADGANVLGGNLANVGLSPEVQDALDRNGITGRSLFQMVHEQYKRKTPMMFGIPMKKPKGDMENPFGDLTTGAPIEL